MLKHCFEPVNAARAAGVQAIDSVFSDVADMDGLRRWGEASRAAGFDIDSKQAVALRVQGVTPEYARSIKQQFQTVSVDDLIQTKIFNIDADFIAQAKRHGFNDLSLKKLVQLRISGIMDDESK